MLFIGSYKFSRVFHQWHVFPLFSPDTCFLTLSPTFSVTCFPALLTGYMFSCLSNWLHVSRPFNLLHAFPPFKPVTCFPALLTCYMFSGPFNRLHVFPSFPTLYWLLVLCSNKFITLFADVGTGHFRFTAIIENPYSFKTFGTISFRFGHSRVLSFELLKYAN